MEKIIYKSNVSDFLDIDVDYFSKDKPFDIDQLISYLNDAKLKGATCVEISGTIDTSYFSNSLTNVSIQPLYLIEETDDELNIRITKAKQDHISFNISKLAHEKDLYLSLKKKFETK